MLRLTPIYVLTLAAVAHAQSEGAPAPDVGVEAVKNRWSAAAELVLWRPALQDDLSVGGGAPVLLESVNLGEPEITLALRTVLTNGDWDIRLEGFIFGTEGSAGEIDYGSLEAIVTKEIWAREFSEDVALRLDAGGGLRASDMSADLTGGMGGPTSDDSVWIDAVVAARIGVELPENFSFDIHGDIGGGLDSFTWSAGTRVRWQPEPYLGVQLGYRFLRTNLDDDGFEFDGALAGLFAGFVFEF